MRGLNTSLHDVIKELQRSITATKILQCVSCTSIFYATWISIVSWNATTIIFAFLMAAASFVTYADSDILNELTLGLAAIAGIIAGISHLAIGAMSGMALGFVVMDMLLLAGIISLYLANHASQHVDNYRGTTAIAASIASAASMWIFMSKPPYLARVYYDRNPEHDGYGLVRTLLGVAIALLIALLYEIMWSIPHTWYLDHLSLKQHWSTSPACATKREEGKGQ